MRPRPSAGFAPRFFQNLFEFTKTSFKPLNAVDSRLIWRRKLVNAAKPAIHAWFRSTLHHFNTRKIPARISEFGLSKTATKWRPTNMKIALNCIELKVSRNLISLYFWSNTWRFSSWNDDKLGSALSSRRWRACADPLYHVYPEFHAAEARSTKQTAQTENWSPCGKCPYGGKDWFASTSRCILRSCSVWDVRNDRFSR